MGEGGRQEAVGIAQGDALVVEGGQEVEDEERIGAGLGRLDELGELEAGEGARETDAAQDGFGAGAPLTGQAGDEVTVEAVAAVEETDREAAGGDGRGRRQQAAGRRLGAPEERDARLEERLQDFGASAGLTSSSFSGFRWPQGRNPYTTCSPRPPLGGESSTPRVIASAPVLGYE